MLSRKLSIILARKIAVVVGGFSSPGVTIVLLAAAAGCAGTADSGPAASRAAFGNDMPAARPPGTAGGTEQAGEGRRQGGTYAEAQAEKAFEAFTHLVIDETDYYTTGPQQARAPDGKLAAGTKVRVLAEAGSYTRVRTEGGEEAYVAADSLRPIDPR